MLNIILLAIIYLIGLTDMMIELLKGDVFDHMINSVKSMDYFVLKVLLMSSYIIIMIFTLTLGVVIRIVSKSIFLIALLISVIISKNRRV